MAEPKTTVSDASVDAFIDTIPDERKRDDCRVTIELMKKATGSEPKMWGGSIVGFGKYRYTYDNGRVGDWPIIGFSPRKDNLTFYLSSSFATYEDLRARLGKHKSSKGSCIYVKKLADVDITVLEQLFLGAVEARSEMRMADE